MQDSGTDLPTKTGAQGKSKKALVVPILSILIGIAALIWWVSSWLIFDSMGWGMCLAVMLPGLAGVILVFYGIGALIKQAIPKDSEIE